MSGEGGPSSGPNSMQSITPTASNSSPQPSSSGQPSYRYSPQPDYPPGSIQNAYGPGRLPQSRISSYGAPPVQGFQPQPQPYSMTSSNPSSDNIATPTSGPGPAMANLTFPTPAPAPSSYTPLKTGEPGDASSPLMSSSSQDHSSNASHDDRNKRYSTATTATFGRWDNNLRTAIRTGESPVSTTSSSSNDSY